MSNAKTIYQEILSSPYFTGSVSNSVKNSHISIIDQLLNYPTGSTTINLWDKLDFFYYFVGDNTSLKVINWKNPNQITASFGNDGNVNSPSYNYSYTSYGQEDIANWWEGKTTKAGNRFSTIASRDKIAAWTSSGAPIENSFVTLTNTLRFYTSSLVNQGVTFFRSGSTLINSTPYNFTLYPDSGSFEYSYYIAQYKLYSVTNGTGSYIQEGSATNTVLFNNLNGTYLGDRSIYQPSITASQTGTNTAITHSITFNKATGRAPDLPSVYSGSLYILRVSDTSNLNQTFPFNSTYNRGFQSQYYYYFQRLQNWIINNSNISSGSNAFLPGLTVYPLYSQLLTLNNGTYFNTNFNLKRKENANSTINDNFIGYLKYSPFGGDETDNTYDGRSINNYGLGYTYAGTADSQVSNNSFALKTNNQYYLTSSMDTGFQVGLGRSISSSYTEKDYAWSAFTSSNPFPYSGSFTNTETGITSYTSSNSSAIAGRPGMYIGQRFVNGNISTIRQYFNNVNVRETTISSSVGNIPDGNLFLNGVGTTTYVDNGYVTATTSSTINTTLATITSVATSFEYNKINYTSSGIITNISVNNANISTLSGGYLLIYPSSMNEGQEYTIVYAEDEPRTNFNLPNGGDTLHLGYSDNPIGNISEVTVNYYTSQDNPNFYTYSITFAALNSTGSIFSGNSIIRSYSPSYINAPSILNGPAFVLEATGSGLYTTASVNTNKAFILNSTKTLSNYYSTTNNNQPNTIINIVSGSDFSFILSGSTPPFDGIEADYYFAIPGGNEIYSGSEFGTTYITDITASYNTTRNDINSTTVFYTTPTNDDVYNIDYIQQNGTLTLPTSSIQGNTFNYRYSGSTTSAQLILLSNNYLIKYQRPNPELSSSYFTPYGQDLKSYAGINYIDSYACYVGGGGIGNTDLSKLYNIFVTDLKVNASYKLTGLSVVGSYNQTASYSTGNIVSTNRGLLMPVN